ncbi:MAG: hypothetical protein LBR81_02640 [Prevotellaceae bacterium]|nr:hypothetical protein [Prevotellaceae bacterium]
MKIFKRRIRNLENYLLGIKENEEFYIGITDIESIKEKLVKVGFSSDLKAGELVLPSILGPISRFNADGKYIKRKDLPKEEYFISRLWSWTDWAGTEYEKVVYIARERYQRDFIAPPNIELKIEDSQESKVLVALKSVNKKENFELIKHTINLLLELFGECDTLKSDFQLIQAPQVIRLNWKILPPGEYPWKKVEPFMKEKIERQSKGNRPVLKYRIEKIASKNPNFVAIGQGGFYEYSVFGFTEKSLYIFESIKTGNATYVFDKDWAELTKLTKKEILDDNLHKKRIIHKQGWDNEIDALI